MPDPFHPDPRELECDLVMKGGVTSGLVYPAAIATIASSYRLRSIGGTSAGAIAAAGAAAMEFGRQSQTNTHALTALGNLNCILSEATDHGASTRLEAMFAGDKGTADLLKIIKRALAGKAGAADVLRQLWQLVDGDARRDLKRAALKTVAQGAGTSGLTWLGAVALAWSEPAQAAAVATALLGSTSYFAWRNGKAVIGDIFARLLDQTNRYLQPVIDNGLGLATGMGLPDATIGGHQVQPLTQWLHDQLQALSGLEDEVLTFGHLWLGHAYPEKSPKDVKSDAPRAIDLVLVATDLNRLQSVNFPFLPERSRLFIDQRQWETLFPCKVMDAIRQASAGPAGKKAVADDFFKTELHYPVKDPAREIALAAAATCDPQLHQNLLLLPDAPDLPVIVAARASLAFPGLFTPLPLWLLHWQDVNEKRVPCFARILLADGGITSNFPIHLFDAPIPTRPTFAINLLYPDDTIIADPFDQNDGEKVEAMAGGGTGDPSLRGDIFMPRSNSGRVLLYKAPPGGTPLAQIGGLAMRVVEAARNWGDISLYSQPGVRDRIVHVRLTDAEGGFNLGMDQATIAALSKKGGLAGEVLTRRFDPDKPSDPLHPDAPVQLNWHNHRFVRLRAFAAAQELLGNRATAAWARATNAAIPQSEPGLDQILKHAGYKKWPSIGNFHIGYTYKLTRDRRNHIRAIIDQLDALKPSTPPEDSSSNSAAVGAPNPRSRLQLRPAGNDPAATKT